MKRESRKRRIEDTSKGSNPPAVESAAPSSRADGNPRRGLGGRGGGYALPLVLLAVGLVAGWSGARIAGRGEHPVPAARISQDQPKLERHQGRTALTNPLLECELSEDAIGNELPSLRPALEAAIAAAKKRGVADELAVYFRDLDNGPWIGFEQDATFIPSSMMKVPLLLAYFKWAETDPSVLDRLVVYEQADFVQTIQPKNPLEVGRAYPVSTLLERTIIESDNNAAISLSKGEIESWHQRVFVELGLPRPQIDFPAGKYEISVMHYAAFFRVLFNASYLNREYSNRALELLSRCSFRRGIVAGVPDNLVVAHKFGERNVEGRAQFHDCGVVYFPDHPYLLCVMSRGSNLDSLIGAAAEISKTVYRVVDDTVTKQKGESGE